MSEFFKRFWDCLLVALFFAVIPFAFLFGIEIGLATLCGYTLTSTELICYGIANIIGYAFILTMLD